jgi:hypothetical protein
MTTTETIQTQQSSKQKQFCYAKFRSKATVSSNPYANKRHRADGAVSNENAVVRHFLYRKSVVESFILKILHLKYIHV